MDEKSREFRLPVQMLVEIKMQISYEISPNYRYNVFFYLDI